MALLLLPNPTYSQLFQPNTQFNFPLFPNISTKTISKQSLIVTATNNLNSNATTATSQIVPNSYPYSIAIRSHCHKNEIDEAKTVLCDILENNLQLPDSATIIVLINSLCKRGKVKKTKEVFELMEKKGYRVSVQAQNCLLKGLTFIGRVDEALEMLMVMKENANANVNENVDVYSYTCVMDGLSKVGRSDEALELFNEGVESGVIVPNVVTFNTLIQGYSREGRAMECVGVLRVMKEHECVPDFISYSTVLHGLLKWNEIEEAFGIYWEMVGLGFEVDFRMMGTLVRRLCKRSRKEKGLLMDAYEVFEKMKERGLVVDKKTVEVMVEALCKGRKFDEVLVNLNDMVRWGYSLEEVNFDKVIKGLCWEGRVDEAVSALILLQGNGGIPSRVTCDVLIRELNAQGRGFCACFLFGLVLKQGVIPNMEPLCYVNITERGEVQLDT